MKKILLTTAAVMAISSSAMAAECDFYAKGTLGGIFPSNKTVKISGENKSFKGSFRPDVNLGVGYYAMDNVRLGLDLGYTFGPNYTNTKDIIKTKADCKAFSAILEGFVDVADLSAAKIFLGAGVGLGHLTGKVKGDINAKLKNANNFAYKVGAGVSTEFTQGVIGEFSAEWRDLGDISLKSKDFKDKIRVQGPRIALGIRFNL